MKKKSSTNTSSNLSAQTPASSNITQKVQWIDLNTKCLPGDYDTVLLATDQGNIFMGFIILLDHTFHFHYLTGVEVTETVTYWMELPKHPEDSSI